MSAVCSDCVNDYVGWTYARDFGFEDAEEDENVIVDYDSDGPIYDQFYKTKDGRIIGGDGPSFKYNRYFVCGIETHKKEKARWSSLN